MVARITFGMAAGFQNRFQQLHKKNNRFNESTSNVTAKEKTINALKPQYKINVLVNIRKQAQFNRIYEPLAVFDLVRTCIYM